MAGKWRESDRVLQFFDDGRRLVVLHRNNYYNANNNTNLDAEPSHSPVNDDMDLLLQQRVQATGARLMRVGHLGSVSSSQVRSCRNVQELRTLVVPRVLEYIQCHRLYQFAASTVIVSTGDKKESESDK